MNNLALAKLLYNGLAYPALSVGAHCAGLFSAKLQRGLAGRRKVSEQAKEFRNQNPHVRIVLFHCASAGELEAVKPLAVSCRERGFSPCVSYFSPSAEAALKIGEFDFADYSPFDSQSHVRKYYEVLKPEVVLISKHDVWPNHVWQANESGIPIWLINGNFHSGSTKTFSGLKWFHREVFSQLTGVLTVSEQDAIRARQITGSADRVWAVGDSRYDRVWARAQLSPSPLTQQERDRLKTPLVVCGSTHFHDEELLISMLPALQSAFPTLGLLIVPHDPSEQAVTRISRLATDAGVTCGELSAISSPCDIVIVNRNGVLADLYQYGALAYVGGGFDRGVHSILEPMAHGLQVICGPKIDVSREANEALREGHLKTVCNVHELHEVVPPMLIAPNRDAILHFVESRAGVGNRILELVLP